MRLVDRVRNMVNGMPEDASVMLSVRVLNEWLKTETGAGDDLTLADLGERYRRAISTVRGWCQRGLFPGAYKLNGRDWKVPVSALAAFELKQRNCSSMNGGVAKLRNSARRPVDTSAWRKVKRA